MCSTEAKSSVVDEVIDDGGAVDEPDISRVREIARSMTPEDVERWDREFRELDRAAIAEDQRLTRERLQTASIADGSVSV